MEVSYVLTKVMVPEESLRSITLAELFITMDKFHKDFVPGLSLEIGATESTDDATIPHSTDGIFWTLEGGARPAIPMRVASVLMKLDFVCAHKPSGTVSATVWL